MRRKLLSIIYRKHSTFTLPEAGILSPFLVLLDSSMDEREKNTSGPRAACTHHTGRQASSASFERRYNATPGTV